MSAQTIIHPTINSLREEAVGTIIANANKYIFKENYALGEDYCDFEQLDACMTYDIIETNNCALLSIIQKGIESIDDSCEEDDSNHLDLVATSNQSLYDLWLSKGNIGTMDNFLSIILKTI